MEKKEIELNGRKYLAYVSPEADAIPGAHVIIGPPEGLVDSLDLPTELADRLHNAFFDRNLFTYRDVSNIKTLIGVLQDVLQVDAHKIANAFLSFEKETVIE